MKSPAMVRGLDEESTRGVWGLSGIPTSGVKTPKGIQGSFAPQPSLDIVGDADGESQRVRSTTLPLSVASMIVFPVKTGCFGGIHNRSASEDKADTPIARSGDRYRAMPLYYGILMFAQGTAARWFRRTLRRIRAASRRSPLGGPMERYGSA
jgi:hypothetical protein